MVSDKNIDLSSITESNEKLIESQLSKILVSSHFKSAHQMQRFLQYIVDQTLSGNAKKLKQYTIAIEALNFSDDFDPDSNPAVRIMAGRVRERLGKFYEQEGKSDSLIISMPKGSYVPQIQTSSVNDIPSTPPNTTDAPIEVVEGKSQGPKLGLFCFEDKKQSEEANQLLTHISSSLAKELTRFLFSRLYVQIPYLHAARSELIGKEAINKFKIDFTLFLFIQEIPDNRFELVYRLWDNSSEEVIDSDILDVYRGQPVDERNTILNKISAVVADLYQGKLHTYWARQLLKDKSAIPERYQALAYYRYYADNLGLDSYKKAVDYCKNALERDELDTVANVLFADYCRRDYVYNFNYIDNALHEGKTCAETAIRLRPDSHEAHFVLGQLLFCLDEWDRSLGEFDQARSLSKNHAVIEYGTGFHLCLMGRWEEGLPLVQKTMALSGSYPSWYRMTLFLDHYRHKNYQEALSEAVKINAPNLMHGPLARCAAYGQLGNIKKAQKELDSLLTWCPSFLDDGKHILRRFLGSEDMAEIVWDGVIKALKK